MEILIFTGLVITSALLSHYFIKKISIAILLAAIATTVIFQLIMYFRTGDLDPYFPVVFAATFVVSFLIALVVGIPFKIWRRINN